MVAEDEGTSDNIDLPKVLRIHDPVIIRQVVEEQHRNRDATPSKTAGRIIDRYFTMTRTIPATSTANS